jgi:hypothetical protein
MSMQADLASQSRVATKSTGRSNEFMQQKKRGSIRRVSRGAPDPDLVERLMNNK